MNGDGEPSVNAASEDQLKDRTQMNVESSERDILFDKLFDKESTTTRDSPRFSLPNRISRDSDDIEGASLNGDDLMENEDKWTLRLSKIESTRVMIDDLDNEGPEEIEAVMHSLAEEQYGSHVEEVEDGRELCGVIPFNFAVVSDLDGTLLPAPQKRPSSPTSLAAGAPALRVHHPKLSEGAVHKSLIKILEDGGAVIGVTGGRLPVQQSRFWDDLPISARREGRVLLFCETGMVLYHGDVDGSPIPVKSYGPFPNNTKRYLKPHVVDGVVAGVQKGIRQWFTDLLENPDLLEAGHFLHSLAPRWSKEDAPVTHDVTQTPRIELRGTPPDEVFGLVIAGIPVDHSHKYFDPYFQEYAEEIHGQPTGRLCYDCVVPGLNKGLVLAYLLDENLITPGRALAMGDSPAGNDSGLTRAHENGVPFISVCHTESKVPARLHDCHVGGNDAGSAAFLSKIGESNVHRHGEIPMELVREHAAQAREELSSKKSH